MQLGWVVVNNKLVARSSIKVKAKRRQRTHLCVHFVVYLSIDVNSPQMSVGLGSDRKRNECWR